MALSSEQIQGLVKRWCVEMLDEDETSRAISGASSLFDFPKDDEGNTPKETEEMFYSYIKEEQQEALAQNRSTRHIKRVALNALKRDGLSVDSGADFNRVCREFTKAYTELLDVFKDRAKGIYTTSHDRLDGFSYLSTSSQQVQQQSGVTAVRKMASEADKRREVNISEALAEYHADKKLKGKWTAKSEKGNTAMITTFIELMGNPKLSEITQSTLREAQLALMNFPANRTKKERYKSLTIPQLRDMVIPEDDRLTYQSVTNYLGCINSFLTWTKTMYELPVWLDSIMEMPKRDELMDTRKARAVFDKEDLRTMFCNPYYATGNAEGFLNRYKLMTPVKFWLPLMALYSGARLEELCQLYIADFEIVDDVQCFRITSLAEDDDGNKKAVKAVKNQASLRLVPLHDDLLSLGLWDYVQELKTAGATRLFEELKPVNFKYGHSFSRWYNKYLHDIGVKGTTKGEGAKVFHSFRHTFINYCVQNRISIDLFERVVGHKIEGNQITYAHYAKELSPTHLKTGVMDKVDFGLNLSILKNNPFSRRKEE